MHNRQGFTLANALAVFGVLAVIYVLVLLMGWGLAFGFVSTVLVPWLQVPAAWANLVSFLLSLAFTGLGTLIIGSVVLLVGGLLFSALGRRS